MLSLTDITKLFSSLKRRKLYCLFYQLLCLDNLTQTTFSSYSSGSAAFFSMTLYSPSPCFLIPIRASSVPASSLFSWLFFLQQMTATTTPMTSRIANMMPRYAPHGHFSSFAVTAATSASVVGDGTGRLMGLQP